MIRVVALLMVLFISTPVAFAADLPEFGQTEREILTLYNQTAKEFTCQKLTPLCIAKNTTGNAPYTELIG